MNIDVRSMTRAVESFSIKNEIKVEGDKVYVTCPFLIANEENKNGRYYLKHALEEGVAEFVERAMNDKFGNNSIMELEHPPLDNDELYYRVTLKNGCGRIVNLWWDGDILMGIYETSLNYPEGKIVIGYHKENVPIGVSVRSGIHVADRKTEYQLYGIDPKDPVEVVDMIRIISWDVVANPGFDDARRIDVSTEYDMDELTKRFQGAESAQNTLNGLDKNANKINTPTIAYEKSAETSKSGELDDYDKYDIEMSKLLGQCLLKFGKRDE